MAGDFITAAADIKAETAQFEQTFGDLEETATKNLEEIGNAAGILPTRLRSAYTQLYAYAKSSGMESAAALEFATKATYAAADAAAYYDRSLEEATEQVLAYTKGNYANDAALGFASTEATRNAQAIKSLGKEYKDLDVTAGETTKVLLDQIIASQELSGAAGQASREMDGWENVTGNLTESWRNFQATAGKPFLENLIPLVQKGAQYLTEFQNSVDWDEFAAGVDKAFQKGENFAKSAVDMGKRILPTFGKAVGFVADHFQSLTKVAIGAYTAVKVLKGISSVTSVVSGFQKAVQTSTVAMSAAQKGMQLLNLTMSANVFGAVAAAAAVLVAGIAALVAIEGQAKTAAEEEAEASKKVAEASKERLSAYQETMDAADKQAAADTEQIAYTKELWTELQKLTDETGKVQEADQARAEFILGELNSALGTEYEMTGNQIENYQDMTAAIGDMIEKKRAQILLDAHEAEYREAITKRTELEKEQVQVTGELAAAKENLSQKEAEYKKISEEVIRQSQSGTRDIDAALQAQAVSLAREVRALKENVQGKQEAYNANEQLIRTYYKNITQYEQASTAAMAGETQKVIDILDQQNAAFIYASDLSGRTQFEQRQILEKQYKDAEQAFELVYQRWQDGVEGITADTVAQARRNVEAARAEFEQMGVNMTDGIATGILRAKPGLNATINNLINGAIASANAAMNAHSPSRRFADEVGANIPSGVAVGVEKNAKVLNGAVGSMIDNSITQMSGMQFPLNVMSRRIREEIAQRI